MKDKQLAWKKLASEIKFEIFGALLKSFGLKMRCNKLQDNEIPSKSVHTITLF